MGIEVPNRIRSTVFLKDVLKDASSGPLQISIGKDTKGNSVVSDLAKMPHLLTGGATGSGKSVTINGIIMSVLMRATPSEVRFILIDPKHIEFALYNDTPHLYAPVIADPKETASALSWGVSETERRLKTFAEIGVRNIGQYNAKVQNSIPKGLDMGRNQLPHIVIVIDELADLMSEYGEETEFSISRIARAGRVVGIHLIVATQQTSTRVVTGLIKANISCRIALNVATGIDSRVILDSAGAETLIGNGDLLYSTPKHLNPDRIQGCSVSDDEIEAVVDHLKRQAKPEYHNEILTTQLVAPDASDSERKTCF